MSVERRADHPTRQNDIYGAYDEAASAKIQFYEAKTSRQKYMEDEDYVGLRDMIWVRPTSTARWRPWS